MSIFTMSNIYTAVWPEGKFSKLIEYNDEVVASMNTDNIYGDQQYWSTIAQNPDYNRPGA